MLQMSGCTYLACYLFYLGLYIFLHISDSITDTDRKRVVNKYLLKNV